MVLVAASDAGGIDSKHLGDEDTVQGAWVILAIYAYIFAQSTSFHLVMEIG